MVYSQKKTDASRGILHTKPDSVEFTMFTTEEIKMLAVCQIVSPMTFDALGYPLAGGLHDKRLGPLSDKSDPCKTCSKNAFSCPGHFGYIELTLPVVNPMFHKVIALLMKHSCQECYHIQIPAHIKYTLNLQLKLLASGRLVDGLEVQQLMSDLVNRYGALNEIPEEELVLVKSYEVNIGTEGNEIVEVESTKNIEDLRNKIISGIWKGLKSHKRCINCKVPFKKVISIKNKLIISDKPHIEKDDPNFSVIKPLVSKPISPEQSRDFLRKMWATDKEVMKDLFPVLKGIKSEQPTDIFFFEIIPVPPSNVRPVNVVAGRMSEHPQTAVYKRVLQDSLLLRYVILVMKNNGQEDVLPAEARAAYASARGANALEKMSNTWEQLQTDVNSLVDNDGHLSGEQGLKQMIEKKAGIIRMNMMGKRVNFAARSVITPDPSLNVDEIGVPEVFAKHLTYPVPVTSWNVEEMRKLITNGPKVHPGAVMVEFEDGRITRIMPENKTQQQALLKRLLTPDGPDKGFKGLKTVHRHLCNGDILLLNRQPTLHRPSIMAHTARVLKEDKTLRLHYANCKAYNADFDGDEMNAHFPQNEVARSEAYYLANVANQYLGPKDGTPLSGLIQDHMIAGVKMSLRGRFFNKMDYQQLVFQALSNKLSNIQLLPPAMIKPQMLWSGKQVFSTVILNTIPKGRAAINLSGGSKIPPKAWEIATPRAWVAGGTPFKNHLTMSEAEIIIRRGELLVGILDKTHYGATPYGLVHCMYELYGGTCAITLLSAFAKLFTAFLQTEGFTLGVKDILVLSEADEKRTEIIERVRLIGTDTMRQALNITEDTKPEEISLVLEKQKAENPKLRSIVDRQYKTALDSFTNDINKVCLPAGLISKFPNNNLQLMVQSGAKGSTVNTMQISCLLGQIELEGKRPPVMISGRSLPSFPVHDFSPRAGGYIDGRFMTGIQPQEFFFHCMAGREGLIDTAVKTSRSGYLQRCLIKHLEGLRIGYDLTVRDSDKSVVQFNYGEDGMDISKVQFLNESQIKFLQENSEGIIDDSIMKQLKSDSSQEIGEHQQQINDWVTRGECDEFTQKCKPFTLFSKMVDPSCKNRDSADKLCKKTGRTKKTKRILKLWSQAEPDIKEPFIREGQPCPVPVVSKFQPDVHFGVLNERLEKLLAQVESKKTKDLLKMKAMQSLCAPGDPVGLLAAQSIGEPSTQMTLNTFHFAGRGEMNVTLGIPRLREILMMASKQLKTPSMEIPFLPVPNLEKRAEDLLKLLTRVVVADVLEKIDVTEELVLSPIRQYTYTLRFQFMPYKLFEHKYNITPKKCLTYMRKTFFHILFNVIKKRTAINKHMASLSNDPEMPTKMGNGNADADDDEPESATVPVPMADSSSDDEPEDAEDAKASNKYEQLHDDQEEEDEDTKPNISQPTTNEQSENILEDDFSAIRSTTVSKYNLAQDYTFDQENYQWCELTYNLPVGLKQIDMTALLKEVASKAVMWETPNIRRAITYSKDDRLTLRTDGVNFQAMFQHSDLLSLNELYSNDVHKIAETYGIEAATKVIVKEVRDVFKVYGITVDPRHLSLIADYMNFSGSYEPLSRKGMESSASPFQQMSFEASLTFLKSAVINGKRDYLQNPSSCIMVGKPCNIGTGSFDLLQNLKSYEISNQV